MGYRVHTLALGGPGQNLEGREECWGAKSEGKRQVGGEGHQGCPEGGSRVPRPAPPCPAPLGPGSWVTGPAGLLRVLRVGVRGGGWDVFRGAAGPL